MRLKPTIYCFFILLVPSFIQAQTKDILKVNSYQLANGLTVFLNQDSTANKVFGAVMVNTGAKHESPNATGMAHYLEHLLFKGTQVFGTADYQKEKTYLDSITVLYQRLGQTTDEDQRLAIQKAINEQAIKASKYGLPNEFDKLLRSIGSTGINAFTSYEMTYYHNSFPAHEIHKWLDLYAARFQNPVFRSFQSELEVVYEEKNRAADNFERKVIREMEGLLFPNLPYGQWPVLGKTAHLKNPPLHKMYEFFHQYYVANNMALILVGNFKESDVKVAIEEKFGKLKSGKITPLELPAPTPFNGREKSKKRITPIKAGFLGYQTVGFKHPDRMALDICEYLLSNEEQTGYIDQLQLDNEMFYCGGFPSTYNDAGGYSIFYVPKVLVQSLKAGEKKIQQALTHLKKGTFTNQQFQEAKNNLSKYFDRGLESLSNRGIMIGQAFNRGLKWEEYLQYNQQINNVSKEEVMRVAQKYFGDNLVNMISRTGFPKKDKLAKPPYKPIVTDQKEESDYVKQFERIPSLPFQPRFLDFSKDISQLSLKEGHQLWASTNPVNDLFNLTIQFKTGYFHDPSLLGVSRFLNYAGAGELSFKQLKSAFGALGCSYSIQYSANALTIQLSGREAQLAECLKLTGKLLHEPTFDEAARKSLVNELKAERKVEKRNPRTLSGALYNYALFEKESYYLKRPTTKDYEKIDVAVFFNKYKEITKGYAAEIFFVGNTPPKELAKSLTTHVKLSSNGKAEEYIFREGHEYKRNKVFLVNDKKARQSRIYFHIQGKESPIEEYASMNAFKEYFSGGFSGIVLQEIREYRSLAYSAGANVITSPISKGKSRFLGFVGCQADKTTEAVNVMVDLLKNMPQKPERMETLRKNLQLKVITNFPSFSSKPATIAAYHRKGLQKDPNINAYESYQSLTLEDILTYYQRHFQDQPIVITIYGDKSKIDLNQLKQLGAFSELVLDDVIRF
ncbi:MAG: M16 family metallopeptidase [Flammeovirgaceae bacterium]